jgi:hypothetical protein
VIESGENPVILSRIVASTSHCLFYPQGDHVQDYLSLAATTEKEPRSEQT